MQCISVYRVSAHFQSYNLITFKTCLIPNCPILCKKEANIVKIDKNSSQQQTLHHSAFFPTDSQKRPSHVVRLPVPCRGKKPLENWRQTSCRVYKKVREGRENERDIMFFSFFLSSPFLSWTGDWGLVAFLAVKVFKDVQQCSIHQRNGSSCFRVEILF